MHSRERMAQLIRVQNIAKTIMHLANPLLKDCEEKPPTDAKPLTQLRDSLKNAEDAREQIIEHCKEMSALENEAWPK